MLGTAQYNPVLWTMHVEFIGSLLVLGWLAIWGKGRHRMIWWIAVCVMLSFYNTAYLPMIAGVISADLYVNQSPKPSGATIVVSTVIVIFFGGMPFSNDLFGVYAYLPKWSIWDYYAVAVPFILSVAIYVKYFSMPVLVWIGKYSFPIYLFHFLVQCFITEGFYIRIVSRVPSYFITLVLTLCFHVLAVVIVAIIYEKTFGKWWGKTVKGAIHAICA